VLQSVVYLFNSGIKKVKLPSIGIGTLLIMMSLLPQAHTKYRDYHNSNVSHLQNTTAVLPAKDATHRNHIDLHLEYLNQLTGAIFLYD